MTTTTAYRDILDRIASDIRRCDDLIKRMHQPLDWRADALERAGDLFVAGRWAESREAARKAREE